LVSLVLFLVGAKLGHPTAGLAAAWLYAISPHAAFWSLTVMTEITFAFTLALALLLWVVAVQTGRWYWFLFCGGVLGASALIRPIGLFLVILWVVITVVYTLRRADLRQSLAWTVSLMIGFSLLVLPWMMRNYLVRDDFVFSTVTGKTLYGFNLGVVVAAAEGISREGGVLKVQESENPIADTLAVIREYPVVFIQQETAGIFRTTTGVESGVWARLFGYGRERQGGFGVLSLLRAGQIGEALERFGGLLSDSETSFHFGLSTYGMLHTILVYVLLLLSIPWALKGGGQSAWVVLLCGITALYFIIVPGAAGQARFRIPVEPILISMAGFGWLYLDSFRKRYFGRETQLVESGTS
jgi:4-amino-4-deoxy-L-arabinose transferase-like glycosyltransferase